MGYIKIHTPIWNNREVGIAKFRFGTGYCDVEIGYKNENDELIYPDVYTITEEQAKQYPVQRVKGIDLYIIPIDKLTIKEERKS